MLIAYLHVETVNSCTNLSQPVMPKIVAAANAKKY